MKTMSLKITDALYGNLTALAEDQGMSRSELVRQALADFFRRRGRVIESAPKGSALAMVEDLAGSVEGPEDLSSNRDHLEDLGR